MSTWYVRTDGDDTTGDGSSGNPWATIGHANDNSANSDTIDIGAGSFTDNLISWRVYQGAGMFETTVTGIQDANGASYNTFYHLYDLTLSLNADFSSRLESYSYNGYGFILQDARILGNGYGTNAAASGGEYMYGRCKIVRSIIDNVKITHGSNGMLMPYGGTPGNPNLYIVNSIISRINYVSSGNYWARPSSNGGNNLIKNNIFYQAKNLNLGSSSLVLSDWKHIYNAYYTGDGITGDTLDATEETFTVDPFVDIANNDFRLSSSSPIAFGEPV